LLRLSAHIPHAPPPVSRALSGGCSPAGIWGGGELSFTAMRLLPFSSLRAASAQLCCGGHGGCWGPWGDAGGWGSQVPRDNGPTTHPCKGGPSPDVHWVCQNLKTIWLFVGGGRKERLVVPFYFYPAFGVDMATIAENNYCLVTT